MILATISAQNFGQSKGCKAARNSLTIDVEHLLPYAKLLLHCIQGNTCQITDIELVWLAIGPAYYVYIFQHAALNIITKSLKALAYMDFHESL